MSEAVQVEGLSKHYGTLRALDEVTFAAQRNTVMGVVGPNGAGKTTLFRTLSTLILPTAGSARVAGYDIRREARMVRQSIGVTFTGTELYARLTARETLRYFGRLYQMPSHTLETRIAELLHLFDMESYAGRLVETLSSGMRQKVVIARAILHTPDVLFMDEPTTSLDIRASADMIDFIRNYAQGRTILLATHNLTEVELLCDTAIVLQQGRVVGAPIVVRGMTAAELQEAIFGRIGAWRDSERLRPMGGEHEVEDDLDRLCQGDVGDLSRHTHAGGIGVHPHHDAAGDDGAVQVLHRE